jgi:hypothetical protein
MCGAERLLVEKLNLYSPSLLQLPGFAQECSILKETCTPVIMAQTSAINILKRTYTRQTQSRHESLACSKKPIIASHRDPLYTKRPLRLPTYPAVTAPTRVDRQVLPSSREIQTRPTALFPVGISVRPRYDSAAPSTTLRRY